MKLQITSVSGITPAALCLLIVSIAVAPAAAQTRTFTVKNNCSETVWAAAAGTPVPVFNGTSSGGIELVPGASATTTVPTPWTAGRIWGRRECTFDSTGHGSCATGDCGGLLNCTHAGAGNTTITEWTLTGSSTGSDNYDISLVDAFDFPVSVQLNDPSPSHCINAACQVDLRNFCTGDQQNKDSAGNVVGCKSLCGKYQTPNYCCAGLYGAPGSCNNVSWNTNFRGTVVKERCNSVYGYAYDDPSSDFNCTPPPATGYTITFCPDSTVPNADPTVAPTFSITATNDGQTVAPGNSVTYNLNVTASSTFTGTVKLSAAHLPQSCTWSGGKSTCTTAASSATFSSTSVSLTPNAVVPVTFTIKTSATTPPILQTSNIEVIGQSGALQNVWEGQITVADPSAPDYTLQVNPNASQTIQPGGSITYNLTLTPVNGFSGTVTLASFVTVPGTATFNPATVTLSGSGSQTATFTIASSSTAAKKTYYPLITAYSGNRLHDFQANLTLSTGGTPDFTIAATPSSQSVVAGNGTTYTVTVSPQNGFTGSVGLGISGLPSGASGSFNPTSISGSGTSTLTVTTSSTTPAGTYTLGINGTSGSLSHSANVTLAVTAAPPPPPQPPSNLTASAVSSSAINLSWSASPTSGVTYDVFRSTTSGFTPSSSNQIASGVTSTSFADSGLTCNTAYFYLIEAANSGGTSSPSNQASATTQACPVGPSVQINAGGPAVAPFVADEDFAGGGTISHANTIDLIGVTNPAPMAVYQTGRDGNFTYTIPGFGPGTSQTVRLHFAETFFSSAASRVFNVSINGTQVLTNFDIFATAGAKNKAVIEQFTENANASGQYVIQFTSVVNNSLVSGIGVLSSGTCSVPSAPSGLSAMAASTSQINLNWTASTSNCALTYNVFRSTSSGFTPSSSNQIASGVTGTTFSDTGLTCNTTYFYLVEATDSAGTSAASNQASAATQVCPTTLVQINAGGPAVSPFVADEDFTGGSTIDHANTIDLSGVTNPAPMQVYQTGRDGNFTSTIPGFGAGSSHTVRLHFAETFWSAAGSRIFNVSINGTQVLTNFDIFAAAGAKNKAVIEQFTVNANSSGQYVIQFTAVKDNSLVSGIEVQ